MPIEDFIIHIFCSVEHSYEEVVGNIRLRRRGFEPKLSDSEVITMEIVGEFLRIDTDKGISKYFRTHWQEWFPQLGSSANFVKQSAKLWAVKQRLLQRLSIIFGGFSDPIHDVDGELQTPLRGNMANTRPKEFVNSLMSVRRLVETVIGQLAGQFHIEKVLARDLWHLTNRFVRKLLSHTMGVFLNRCLGRESLQLEGLITS